MVKSIIYKRVFCLILCVILVFDVTYTKKQEADAFAFVLTPAIVQCIITGLAITGVIVGSESFQNASLNFWNSASDGVKEYFHRVSTGAKYLADKTVQFSTNSMEYFKQYVLNNFSSGGGSVSDSFFPTFDDKNNIVFSSPQKTLRYGYLIKGIDGSFYLSTNSNPYVYSIIPMRSPDGKEYLFANQQFYNSGIVYSNLNYVFTDNNLYYVFLHLGNFNFSDYFDVVDGEIKSYSLICKGTIYTSLSTSVTLTLNEPISFDSSISSEQNAINFYKSWLFENVKEQVNYDYSINSTAYPSTGSICPDVAIDTVINVPAVNSNVGINSNTANDLLGGVTAVPFNPTLDIPDIGVIAPPIAPPADGILGFLENIWTTIKAIPQSISSAFEKYFDVTEFKLDFSVLKNAGIQNKFPFCIPFDLYNVLKTVLKPVEVDFRIKLDTIYFKIDYMLPINEPIFQLVRNFFRWSALFGFIISLIRGTKNLIKW